MSSTAQSNALVSGILESIDGEQIVLRVPHTDYRLHLHLTTPAGEVATPCGRRLRGAIGAEAMKLHIAGAGGRFIEPVIGEPRILAGTVLAVDEPNRRVLVDVTVPICLTVRAEQDLSILEEGVLINCYVRSGATFTPAER